MKKIYFSLLACITIVNSIYAQEWDLGVKYSAWLANPLSGRVYKNTPVSGEVAYNDRDGNELYREAHSGASDLLGNFAFEIGKGAPKGGSLTMVTFKQVFSISYTFTVNIDGEDVELSDELPVTASPRANAAACALMSEDSKRLGGADWTDEVTPITEIFCPPNNLKYYFNSLREPVASSNAPHSSGDVEREFVSTSFTQIVRKETTTQVNSGLQVDYLSVGTGQGLPMRCGMKPAVLDAFHSIRMPTIGQYNYGLDLYLDDYDASHVTTTLRSVNQNQNGFGMYAVGTTGLYALGQYGVSSITAGSGNGWGTYGNVDAAPATNGFKWGLAANAGGFPFSYAAMFFGPVVGDGPYMQMSDARLKTNLRVSSNALAQIKLLSPTIYEFIENTPYHFSKGIHHGFLAQELESVFPELVQEIAMPTTLDPDEIKTCETVYYKAINYGGLIPILTGAIQELDAKVVSQQTEINMLKDAVQQLSSRLTALEN